MLRNKKNSVFNVDPTITYTAVYDTLLLTLLVYVQVVAYLFKVHVLLVFIMKTERVEIGINRIVGINCLFVKSIAILNGKC